MKFKLFGDVISTRLSNRRNSSLEDSDKHQSKTYNCLQCILYRSSSCHTPCQTPFPLDCAHAEAWTNFHHNVYHPTNLDFARDTAFSFRPYASLAVYSASFETFAGYSIFRQDCQHMVITRLSTTEHNYWWAQTQRPNGRMERLWEARKFAGRGGRGQGEAHFGNRRIRCKCWYLGV